MIVIIHSLMNIRNKNDKNIILNNTSAEMMSFYNSQSHLHIIN